MSKILKTESIYINTDDLSELCHLSKNLYNNANYSIRQELQESGKWIRYSKINILMKEKEEQYNDYYKIPVQSAQQTLKRLDKNWKGFFKSIKIWKLNPSKFKEMPKPPRYLKKDGETIIGFTNQQCKIRNGKIKFPKIVKLEVKTRLPDNTNLREVRIVPKGIGYMIEIVYQIEVPELKLKQNRIGSIDLGLRNLVTFGDNIGGDPIIIKGGIVKSINQFYNKERAKIRSIYDHQKIKYGMKLKRLEMKRFWKIKDYFHKVSKKIIDICKERNIDTLIIGHTVGWKQEINLGKTTNQNFVSIPFNILIKQLEYKGMDIGMEVIVNEESYTSKCSFLDLEEICKHETYLGKRISRGLFKSGSGKVINADVNAMYNIMIKAIPKAFADGIEGIGMYPRRLSV
jgi:IS605 OrfB family transposase